MALEGEPAMGIYEGMPTENLLLRRYGPISCIDGSFLLSYEDDRKKDRGVAVYAPRRTRVQLVKSPEVALSAGWVPPQGDPEEVTSKHFKLRPAHIGSGVLVAPDDEFFYFVVYRGGDISIAKVDVVSPRRISSIFHQRVEDPKLLLTDIISEARTKK